jgi:hypothetical protein
MDRKWVLGLTVALITFVAPMAAAQYDSMIEISGLAGYTWSDGVTFDTSLDNYSYNKIEPGDAFSWGLTLGYMLPYGTEVEFLYDRDDTQINLGGLSGNLKLGDLAISNYHGLLVYNIVNRGKAVIPYFFGGLGATSYGDVAYTALDGSKRTASGMSKFSTTWGAGLKIYPQGKPVGLKLQFRWTPTYIKSDTDGYWCDPYWGCYTTGTPQYSNQVELKAGLTFRFPVGR